MKKLKSFLLLTIASVGLGISSVVMASGLMVDGKVYYKISTTNEVVKRNVQLELPPEGNGDVYLHAGEHVVKADKFFHKKHNGRVLFYIIFKNPPHSPANSLKVFRGTYVRGSNLAFYDGEVFTRVYSSERSMSLLMTKDLLELEHLDMVASKFNYQAGFFFKAMIANPDEADKFLLEF